MYQHPSGGVQAAGATAPIQHKSVMRGAQLQSFSGKTLRRTSAVCAARDESLPRSMVLITLLCRRKCCVFGTEEECAMHREGFTASIHLGRQLCG